MTEGPIIPMVLEADNAIEKLRKVMGATDPAKADCRNDSEAVRHEHRAKRDSRFGRARHSSVRDLVLFQSARDELSDGN